MVTYVYGGYGSSDELQGMILQESKEYAGQPLPKVRYNLHSRTVLGNQQSGLSEYQSTLAPKKNRFFLFLFIFSRTHKTEHVKPLMLRPDEGPQLKIHQQVEDTSALIDAAATREVASGSTSTSTEDRPSSTAEKNQRSNKRHRGSKASRKRRRQLQHFLGVVPHIPEPSTRMSFNDVQRCVEKRKVALRKNVKEPLGKNQHGVNVFNVYELKQRRRVITETLLNSAIGKKSLPTAKHPSRIEKRQQLRRKKYMFQMDFDAFYDSIPLPEEVQECFVFKKGNDFYALLTLPTGARWSVCVGQSITWVLMNFPNAVLMFSTTAYLLFAPQPLFLDPWCFLSLVQNSVLLRYTK
jgi:hypothetical protein